MVPSSDQRTLSSMKSSVGFALVGFALVGFALVGFALAGFALVGFDMSVPLEK